MMLTGKGVFVITTHFYINQVAKKQMQQCFQWFLRTQNATGDSIIFYWLNFVWVHDTMHPHLYISVSFILNTFK